MKACHALIAVLGAGFVASSSTLLWTLPPREGELANKFEWSVLQAAWVEFISSRRDKNMFKLVSKFGGDDYDILIIASE
jgi:hypothetical protein